jgi:sec-independent protein translocase protein TatC
MTGQPNPPGLGPEEEQPFITHLMELRDRLLRIVFTVLVVFAVLFPFSNTIYTWVAGPLMAHLPEGSTMIAIEVASPFLTPFKLSLVSAIFLSVPMILYQLWAFVAPGLYQHERRLIYPLMISSTLLFYAGMAFAYFLVFPLVFAFFTATAPEGVAVMTDIARYLDFILTLFFAFGVAFEVPIATFLLCWAGVTTPESLAEKRPYVIVATFVIGMLLTPPDVISQTLLALPMWVLFELGLIFSRIFLRNRARAEDEEEVPAAHAAHAPGTAGRYRPMTQEEMDAELDSIQAQEQKAPRDPPPGDTSKPS